MQSVYKDKARYCVIFASKAYAEKLWTKHELRQAQARAFAENQEYILPLRIDETEIPGVNHTIGYIDVNKHGIDEIAELLCRKLWGYEDALDRLSWTGEKTVYNGQEMSSFWPKRIERAQELTEYEVISSVPRIRYGGEKNEWEAEPCHDCGVLKGEFHVPGCDVEECPICHRQQITCSCGVLWEEEQW